MNQSLTYQQALERHPEQVADVLRQVRKGRSKTKNADPSTWTWSYDWCVEIHGSFSFEDLLSGKQEEERQVRLSRSLEERVNGLIRDSHVALRGHTGSSDVPSEVLREHYTETVTAEMAEEARAAAMSPEQRHQEAQEALRYLMGPRNKGFMAISIPITTAKDSTDV